jgi:molybdopterin molybdotransferase
VTIKKPGKLVFLRVRIEVVNGRLQAFTSGVQQTGLLKTMLRADAIALIPADSAEIRSGAEVRIYLLREELLMGEPGDSLKENGL